MPVVCRLIDALRLRVGAIVVGALEPRCAGRTKETHKHGARRQREIRIDRPLVPSIEEGLTKPRSQNETSTLRIAGGWARYGGIQEVMAKNAPTTDQKATAPKCTPKPVRATRQRKRGSVNWVMVLVEATRTGPVIHPSIRSCHLRWDRRSQSGSQAAITSPAPLFRTGRSLLNTITPQE